MFPYPGCTSAGETQNEALEGIREAIALYLEQDPIKLNPGAMTREVMV